jgi:hypothetical protein
VVDLVDDPLSKPFALELVSFVVQDNPSKIILDWKKFAGCAAIYSATKYPRVLCAAVVNAARLSRGQFD